MKSILGAVLFFMASQSFAYTPYDIQGTYRLTSENMPIISILKIDELGRISIVEEKKRFTCKGTSELVSDQISAKVKCKNFFNDRVFEFVIDLTTVTDLNSFTTPLMFPMIGAIQWKFKKIK